MGPESRRHLCRRPRDSSERLLDHLICRTPWPSPAPNRFSVPPVLFPPRDWFAPSAPRRCHFKDVGHFLSAFLALLILILLPLE